MPELNISLKVKLRPNSWNFLKWHKQQKQQEQKQKWKKSAEQRGVNEYEKEEREGAKVR